MAVKQELLRSLLFTAAILLLRFLCGGFPSACSAPIVALGGLQAMILAQAIVSVPQKGEKAAEAVEQCKELLGGPLFLPAIATTGCLLASLYASLPLESGLSGPVFGFRLCGKFFSAFGMGGLFHMALQGTDETKEPDEKGTTFQCTCRRACGRRSDEPCPYSDDFWSTEVTQQ
mmetsp:Transcript_35785/g.64929  ORF Transcript_35785/g.64929 Transcript_35785/m.64929 type:complete len:174 (+) Transcript_35785:136-657(+)|eukprot:CAMPEP_0197648810 /NCGR_PEP_ID=MMETSP1338-20131121/27973_1 /TAXON_ID=43686 ORGANISM="Pelagodinium beii, Strain RCC1491" /NCGR_SAMPLE_ID=MMETSP1338 /ASSEMBLY_ACC=CAM_ASM_000754 /LENGTH=173 /DNA_ID=CAMNT_0043222865 /DNA_START=110 /DNA_END=631 /DNA_ORIENTATION=+